MIMLGVFAKLAGVPSRDAIFASLELLMGRKKAVYEAGCRAVDKGLEYLS